MSEDIKARVIERLSCLNKKGMVKELLTRGMDSEGSAREIKIRLAEALYIEFEGQENPSSRGNQEHVRVPWWASVAIQWPWSCRSVLWKHLWLTTYEYWYC